MVLKKEESDLFYSLIWPLLAFVANCVLDSEDGIDLVDIFQMDNNEKGFLFESLWSNTEFIDDFIELNSDMGDVEKELLTSWKRVISSEFVVERYLKNGTIFIDMKTDKVYQVCGIVSDYDEMFVCVKYSIAQQTSSIVGK